MSQYSQQIAVVDQSISTASKKYHNVVPVNSDLKWGTEKVFASDLMRKNKDLRSAIPETQVSAILQAGSMGLTLNPAAGECYLIPRATTKGGNTFIAYASPSYRGLIKTAVDSGAILYGVAEVVYAKDHFEYFGKTKPPIHIVDVMKPRGEPVGAYALAKLPNGETIPEWMDKDQIMAVKNKSDNPGGMMWNEFWTQGWCKAVLRRAQKTWPRSKQLNTAVQILNDNEGVNFEPGEPSQPDIEGESVKLITDDQVLTINNLIKNSFDDSETMMGIFVKWLRTRYSGVYAINDLPAEFYDDVVAKINESINHKKAAAK